MEKEIPISSSNISKNIIKEIESLPEEFKEKSEEVGNLQLELNDLRLKYDQKEKQIIKISKDIINIENYLTSNLEEISKIKSEQKIIIDSLNEESFKNFTQYFYKIPNNYQEIILIFLKYEGNLKNELNFLLTKQENLHQLLRDSYSYFKYIEEIDKEKYELCKNKIKNLENRDNNSRNKNNHKNKLGSPFDVIINFIENTFRIIEINKNNKEINKNIIDKSAYKEKLFIENILLHETIKEKQEKLKNINQYIKLINNIQIKYKNFSGNSNINKNNNSTNNNNTNNSKSVSYNKYENNEKSEKNEKNESKKILSESTKLDNKNLEDFKLSDKLNNNNNNNNILISSNINNEKNKILLKSNNPIKNVNNNLDFVDNKSNNFYHAVSNFKKKNSSNSESSPNSIICNANNIKIISIVTSSNKNLENKDNIKDNNTYKINSSNSIDYSNKNQRSFINNYSALNQKEGKKIKIGSLSMYQSSTSKKYKNKIIKTNSFEQVESRKIFINKPITNNEQNKSYTEKVDYDIDENKDKITNINQYQERNLTRENKQIYYSYQLNNDKIKDNKNINKNKNLNQCKSIKEEDDKKTIVDNYNNKINNNNIIDDKQNENNENNENNRRKNFYLSPGIYNNNRKILKMFEMNKNNNKEKNKK